MQPAHTYAAKLIRVIDADTIVIDLDLGFHVWTRNIRVRLARINAPEMNTDAGRFAKQFVDDWFTCHPAIVVRTMKDKSGADKADSFGRYLAEVYPAGDDVAQRLAVGIALGLSDLLLAAGHAKEYKP